MNSTQTREIAANILRTIEEMQKRNDIIMITISYSDKVSCSFIPSEAGNYSIAVNEIIVAAKKEADEINNLANQLEEKEDPKENAELLFNEKIVSANNAIKAGDYLTGISLLKEASLLNEDHKDAIEERLKNIQELIISGK